MLNSKLPPKFQRGAAGRLFPGDVKRPGVKLFMKAEHSFASRPDPQGNSVLLGKRDGVPCPETAPP